MKKRMGSLIGVALLLAAVSASAQTTNAIRFKVPFPFVTAGKSWPAADYRVQIRTDNGTVTLSSLGIGSATMLTSPDARPGETRTLLHFERAGDRWYLQEVTVDGTARIVPTGELQKALVKEQLSVEAQPSIEP
jgi:hypothetical protein